MFFCVDNYKYYYKIMINLVLLFTLYNLLKKLLLYNIFLTYILNY